MSPEIALVLPVLTVRLCVAEVLPRHLLPP